MPHAHSNTTNFDEMLLWLREETDEIASATSAHSRAVELLDALGALSYLIDLHQADWPVAVGSWLKKLQERGHQPSSTQLRFLTAILKPYVEGI
jgi:NTP pyrophosphatase (non-canonical NTP hydrolase)